MLIGDVDRKILELFSENVVAFYSINQIAKRLGKKYPYINKRVSALLGLGILKKSILGTSYLCSLNLASDSAVAMLSLMEINKRDIAAAKNSSLKTLLEQVKADKRELSLICAVISGQQLICVSQEKQPPLRLKGFTSVAADRKAFLDMISNEGIVKNHVILYGFECYFKMIREVEKELRAQQIQELA